MSRVLVFILLLMSARAMCFDNKHKPLKMPVSRWREVSRMKPDSTVMPFSDTLFISFLKKDSFSYHNKNGFIYNGPYTISEDSILDFGTVRYRIAAKKPTSLVLTNDMGIFTMGIDSSDTAKVIVLEKDEKILPVTNIDQMIGRWTVYKRTTKEQGASIDNSVSIRSAFITGPSTDGKLGFLFSGKDAGNDPSWYIKSLEADQTLICDGKGTRMLRVVKCQKGEMILEGDGATYYFKQFK